MSATSPLRVVETFEVVPPLGHAENPAQPGQSLCGVPLSNRRASATARCVVCVSLTHSDWSSR